MKKLLTLLLSFTLLFGLVGCGNKEEVKEKDARPEVITLDVDVTPEMDFFKDGYEIVTYASLGDGDTTTFNLKSGTYPTRYICIDTPETSNGLDPWGLAAKRYTNDALKNAKEIVLARDSHHTMADRNEKNTDENVFDRYGRLIAYVYVDGELLQWHLVNESLAQVKYLYLPYDYSGDLISLEAYVKEHDNRRIHNKEDKDPEYNYDNSLKTVTIKEVRDSMEDITTSLINKSIKVEGVVTAKQGGDAFIQDGDSAMFVYTNGAGYNKALKIGNRVSFEGNVALYHGQLQVANLTTNPVIVSEGNDVTPREITYEDFNLDNESIRVVYRDLTFEKVPEKLNPKGQNFYAKDAFGNSVTVRVQKGDMYDFKPEMFTAGVKYDIIANIGQYDGTPQLILSDPADIILK